MLPATLQFLIVIVASAINDHMQKRLDYKTEEVVVLKELIKALTGKARIDFTDNQRKRPAAKGKELTPKEREEYCEIIRPRTILNSFRKLYSEKHDSSQSRGPGRPRKPGRVEGWRGTFRLPVARAPADFTSRVMRPSSWATFRVAALALVGTL